MQHTQPLNLVRAVLVRWSFLVFALPLWWAPQLHAASSWAVDDKASEVTFVSVKSGDIAEVHSISQLSGSVVTSEQGEAEVNLKLHLASVDTGIAVRDERIREHLFETANFPTANVHGHLRASDYLNLAVGDSLEQSLDLVLDLHGIRIPITVAVLVARLAEDRMMITSTRPLIVNAASLDLVQGIEKLRELAGLPSISNAVPVSLVLTLVR